MNTTVNTLLITVNISFRLTHESVPCSIDSAHIEEGVTALLLCNRVIRLKP